MIETLNHFSYAIASALALLAIGWWAYERRTWRALAVLGLAATFLVGADLLFRPGDPSIASAAELDRVLADGKPTLLEFYSNY